MFSWFENIHWHVELLIILPLTSSTFLSWVWSWQAAACGWPAQAKSVLHMLSVMPVWPRCKASTVLFYVFLLTSTAGGFRNELLLSQDFLWNISAHPVILHAMFPRQAYTLITLAWHCDVFMIWKYPLASGTIKYTSFEILNISVMSVVMAGSSMWMTCSSKECSSFALCDARMAAVQGVHFPFLCLSPFFHCWRL